MLTSKGLEGAILDVLNWTAQPHLDRSEVARVSGLSRPTIYKAQLDDWDPPISTVIALAIAREKISGIEPVEDANDDELL